MKCFLNKEIIKILFLMFFYLLLIKNVEGKNFGVDFINVENFGVKPVLNPNETQKEKYNRWLNIQFAFDYCIKNGFNLYFPSGIYDVGIRNFPFRSSQIQSKTLLDCKSIIIYGSGKSTIFMTNSNDGADVLQLNNLKNLTIKDISITAKLLSKNKSGSNGISITNGFDNINLENIFIYDLPGVDKNTYIDGGKGVTIQISKGNLSPKGVVNVKNVNVKNSAYGFKMDANQSDILNYSTTIKINISMTVENAYQGYSVTFAAPYMRFDNLAKLNITSVMKLINCQQYVRMSRVVGGKYNFILEKSQSYKTHNWMKKDLLSFALLGNYVKHVNLSIKGNVGKVDNKLMLGTIGSITEPFGIGNFTDNSVINFDVAGRSMNSEFYLIQYLGKSIQNSIINISNSNLDKSLDIKLLRKYNNEINISN